MADHSSRSTAHPTSRVGVARTELDDTHPADYDVTIPTPAQAAPGDPDETDPTHPEPGSDTGPAGDQPAPDEALDDNGVPLRADGTPARDKGEVD